MGPGSRSRWGSGKERETSRQRPEWAGSVAEEQYEGREGSRVRGAVVGPFVVNLWLLSTLDPEDGGIQAAARPQNPKNHSAKRTTFPLLINIPVTLDSGPLS